MPDTNLVENDAAEPSFSTVQSGALLARQYFTELERGATPDGNRDLYWATREGSPDWLTDLCRDAHEPSGLLPDDYVYRWIVSALEALSEFDHEPDADELHEWADGMVPIYTHDRLQWLASHLDRVCTVDDAVSEYGTALTEEGDGEFAIAHVVGLGIYREIEAVGVAVLNYLAERVTA